MRIACHSGREAVYLACKALLTAPEVAGTRELVGVTFEIADPTDMLPEGIGHVDFRPALAAAEALHIISGAPYGETIRRITAGFESRRWDYPEMSYGVRLRAQLEDIVLKLTDEDASRQAVAFIGRPDDLANGATSYFCATQVQFLLRDGLLHMIVGMRSNDAWHGLPYNLFQFAQLQNTLAGCLGATAGRYVHNVGSLHLYARHFEKAQAMHFDPYLPGDIVGGVGRPFNTPALQAWSSAKNRARILLEGGGPPWASLDEFWYEATLKEGA